MRLRGVSYPGCGKTAPRKETKSLVSVLKVFCDGNSLMHFSIVQAWRGFALLTRIAVLLRSLTAMCTDGV